MIIYNIQTNGPSNQLVIELMNDSVYVESNMVAYTTGKIEIDANNGGMSGKIRSRFIGKKHFKPCFSGTGKIYMKATLGTYHKFSLKDDEELIINADAFIACRNTISMQPKLSISMYKFVSGAPMITTLVKGNGTVMVLMPGPVAEYTLNTDRFVAFANDIAAYSTNLKLTREFAAKGWLPISHKMVQVFRGAGTVYFCPNSNKGARRAQK